jgi:hypothetical protein
MSLPSPTERAILEIITNIISSGVDMEALSFFVVVVFERHGWSKTTTKRFWVCLLMKIYMRRGVVLPHS